MDPQSVSLIKSLKNLFGKTDQSDCFIEIYEIDKTLLDLGKRKLKIKDSESMEFADSIKPEELYCRLPAHSCILTLQSEYFKNMYEHSKKHLKTNNFTLKVDVGEGQYVYHFIKTFYDHDIFEEMDVYKYLRIIELADRYNCHPIIQQAISKETSIVVQNLNVCETLFKRISKKKYCLTSTTYAIECVIKKCTFFAAKMFCPLELTFREDKQLFLSISFDFLIAILKNHHELAYHEDTILYLLTLWLEHDTLRQTESNIKKFLSNINYKYLTGNFLLDVISEHHEILCKWSDYLDWYISAVGYHAHSPKRKCIADVTSSHDIGFDRNSDSQLKPIFYKTDFFKDTDKNYKPKQKFFLYHGYKFHHFIEFGDNLFSRSDDKNDSIEINFGLEIMNFRMDQYDSDELHKFSFAIGFEKGPVDRNVDYSVFQQLREDYYMVRDITCFSGHTTYPIGRMLKSYLERLDEFSIYITLKDTVDPWRIPSLYEIDQEDSELNIP